MRAAALGAVLIALVSVCVLLDATLTVLGGVVLALAALCLIPLLFRATSRMLKGFARRYHGGMVAVAAIEIDGTATRSIALAGVAALAVYGVVAVGGARHDLLRGLDNAIAEEWGSAPVWVTPDGNIFDADSFRIQSPGNPFARAGGAIASVHIHQGGFLDLGTHRIWIRAVPANNSTMVLSSQLLKGDLASATARHAPGRLGDGLERIGQGTRSPYRQPPRSAHPLRRRAAAGRRDHHEHRMAVGHDQCEHAGLQSLLAQHRSDRDLAEPRAGGQRRHRQGSRERVAQRSTEPACADLAGTHRRGRELGAPGSENPQRDLDAAADRGCACSRHRAVDRDLSETLAPGLAESAGLRPRTAVAVPADGKRDRARVSAASTEW